MPALGQLMGALGMGKEGKQTLVPKCASALMSNFRVLSRSMVCVDFGFPPEFFSKKKKKKEKKKKSCVCVLCVCVCPPVGLGVAEGVGEAESVEVESYIGHARCSPFSISVLLWC